MRVIIDANVVIAAVAARGLCEALMELCLEHHQIIFCEGLLNEVENKLRDKLKVPSPIISDYLKFLRDNAKIYVPDQVEANLCRDPHDLMVLGLVSAGKVAVIVTGDKDLLSIKEYQGVPIMTPRCFWESNKKDLT